MQTWQIEGDFYKADVDSLRGLNELLLLCVRLLLSFSIKEAEAKSLWDTCLVKITLKCALSIIVVVFGNGTIIESCCNAFVQEGKMCHDNLIKYIADRPSLIGRETQYLKKRDDVWSHCVSISKTA
ncbi:putative Prolamin-like domain-containing protein [Arabidopsis thaliana]